VEELPTLARMKSVGLATILRLYNVGELQQEEPSTTTGKVMLKWMSGGVDE